MSEDSAMASLVCPIELVGGRHDGTQLQVPFEKDTIKYKGISYADTNMLAENEGRVIYRCNSREGRLRQEFFEREFPT